MSFTRHEKTCIPRNLTEIKIMYVDPNFKTKKALREAVKNGKEVAIFQPGPFGGREPREGLVVVEGPHYPEPHKWYARVELKDGQVVKVH